VGPLVTTAWRVLGLRTEWTASSIGGYLQIYRIKSRGKTTRGGPPAWGWGVGLTNPHRKKHTCYEKLHKASDLDGFLDKRPKRRNMDMRFGTWKIRSLHRVGSLMTVSREPSRYRLDLVGVQFVRWEGSGTALAGEYKFSCRKGNENHELGTAFYCTEENHISS
jgi:hypothetical protein